MFYFLDRSGDRVSANKPLQPLEDHRITLRYYYTSLRATIPPTPQAPELSLPLSKLVVTIYPNRSGGDKVPPLPRAPCGSGPTKTMEASELGL